jgi:hypothetical protein
MEDRTSCLIQRWSHCTPAPPPGPSFPPPSWEPDSYKPLAEFHRFADLPAELRLMIWRAAIPVDFSNNSISVKTYSYTYRGRRAPPKTLSINQESRNETLKYFRRVELQQPEISEHSGHKWLRKYPTQLVLWDNATDDLTLDWWCLVSNVTHIIKYLNLQPFVDQDTGTISCVKILDIDLQAWNFHYGSYIFGHSITRVLGAHVMEPIEKKLRYFVGLREVRLSMWSPRRTFDEETYFLKSFEECFKRLAEQNAGYCIPRTYLVPQEVNDPRKLLR